MGFKTGISAFFFFEMRTAGKLMMRANIQGGGGVGPAALPLLNKVLMCMVMQSLGFHLSFLGPLKEEKISFQASEWLLHGARAGVGALCGRVVVRGFGCMIRAAFSDTKAVWGTERRGKTTTTWLWSLGCGNWGFCLDLCFRNKYTESGGFVRIYTLRRTSLIGILTRLGDYFSLWMVLLRI